MSKPTKIQEFKHLFVNLHADDIKQGEVLRLAMIVDFLRLEIMEEHEHDLNKMAQVDADLSEFARDIEVFTAY